MLNLTRGRLCSNLGNGCAMGVFIFWVHHAAPLFLQWPITQLSPAALAIGTWQGAVFVIPCAHSATIYAVATAYSSYLKIDWLMACTICFACLVSTVSGHHKNALGIGSASSGNITKPEPCTFLRYQWVTIHHHVFQTWQWISLSILDVYDFVNGSASIILARNLKLENDITFSNFWRLNLNLKWNDGYNLSSGANVINIPQ